MKKYKAVTPSLRHTVVEDRVGLWKGSPVKALTKGSCRTGGRNNRGCITIRGIGGGHKRVYRKVDFIRKDEGSEQNTFKVLRREYDPFRNSYIILIQNTESGSYHYILDVNGLNVGDLISNNRCKAEEFRVGDVASLKYFPEGQQIHNVELRVGKGGQLARSDGAFAMIVQQNILLTNFSSVLYTMVQLPSGEFRLLLSNCRATVGCVGSGMSKNVQLGKAGKSRWLGIRPKVRGVAMNPVDHPHGGGEGRTSGGRPAVSYTAKIGEGKPSRGSKWSDKLILTKRKK